MIKKKTKKQEIEYFYSVTCNKCKKEFYYDDTEDEQDELEIQEFCHISFVGGYGSVFGDGTEVKIDLCQRCLKEMIGDLIE